MPSNLPDGCTPAMIDDYMDEAPDAIAPDEYLLNGVSMRGAVRYGCHNKPRPVNGAEVIGTEGHVAARSVWNGSSINEPVPCIYTDTHDDDELCYGCKHK